MPKGFRFLFGLSGPSAAIPGGLKGLRHFDPRNFDPRNVRPRHEHFHPSPRLIGKHHSRGRKNLFMATDPK